MIDVEAIPEESLRKEEIADRMASRENFRTPQLWGAKISEGLYATGSTALINDDNEPRVSAVINWQGQILPASPLTNISFYEKMLNTELVA